MSGVRNKERQRRVSQHPAIELVGIDKSFGTVHANKNINLKVEKGTIHGIIGENGAGKSTLMSILYGFYQADGGEIRIDGKPLTIRDSQAAIAAGIGMVHQHFMLVENFTVLENIMLGAEGGQLLAKGVAGARKELKRLETDYGLDVDPDAVIEDLPVGKQQRVEILKALYRNADGRPDAGGSRSPVQGAESVARPGQDRDPHHPQAARDHGDHR
jgi:general nucleoside transport system ATP-binding protein